jgi:hypothetical protein
MARSQSVQELITEADLFEFFRTRVEEAVAHQRAPVSNNTVYYLSHLLAEQGRAQSDGDPTLVELRQRAVEASRAESVTIWKQLGDRTLVVTGYFREQLDRRKISRDYYARMGCTAYDSLSRMLGGEGFGGIFGELAARWEACSDVIAEVRDEAADRNDADVVRLYEEWLKTGSPRIAERLRTLGVVPMRSQGAG